MYLLQLYATVNVRIKALRILERMQVTNEEILKIEVSTKGQWENPHYRSQQVNSFSIWRGFEEKGDNSLSQLGKKKVYETNFSSEAMVYGRANESVALQTFQKQRSSARISITFWALH
ncbi:unnamed protein product [Psylliodes chrysocephalus]|uniref:Uncharacterized protein n=1 Tax=Psylliodes chrysocephalus TaxID=3402493 RepID=A0A9P0DAH1_9CUCU|nr:unnamed protein product [Psylliodes chrysocephala]